MAELREKQAKTCGNQAEVCPDTEKTCQKCGIPQPLERFPFRKDQQQYRTTCKACRAAESHALRHHPDHAARIREAERLRSFHRRAAILKWQREHPERMRPGRRRRWQRRKDKLKRAAYRPLLGPFRAVLPPAPTKVPSLPKPTRRPSLPRGGRGSKSSGDPSLTP